VLWSEWNGKYRDNVRKFWKGDPGQIAELAYRLSGSSDLYRLSGRGPSGSINFLTAHDGFTLRDLVSYNEKHNEANGEDNRDGESHNRSWNCGVEGPTDDPQVNELRSRQQRNFITTLLLSQGIPMILGGDEFGRTQGGNNNAYCQDSEISWYDWNAVDESLLEFTRHLIQIHASHPVFRRRRWFQGRPLHSRGAGVSDIAWFRPDGQEMSGDDWQQDFARSFGVFLNGGALPELDEDGRSIEDDSFLLIFNAHHDPIEFTIPGPSFGRSWDVAVDTNVSGSNQALAAGSTLMVTGRSLIVAISSTRD
jgi:glycogen operon protein